MKIAFKSFNDKILYHNDENLFKNYSVYPLRLYIAGLFVKIFNFKI